MSDFREIAEFHWVESCGTFGHSDTVSGDGVGHVIVIYQVNKWSRFDFRCYA